MSDETLGPLVPNASPPTDSVGGWVPWILILNRSPNIYAVLQDFEAFPSGARFVLRARFRPGVFDPLGTFPGAPGGPHIGVTFSDGRSGTVGSGPVDPQPGDVILRYHSGSGGSHDWRMDLWLSPLPPTGRISFEVGWPEKGAPVTSVSVESAELIAAASNAERLW